MGNEFAMDGGKMWRDEALEVFLILFLPFSVVSLLQFLCLFQRTAAAAGAADAATSGFASCFDSTLGVDIFSTV